jgi:adenine-specific DNA-methyltransferase
VAALDDLLARIDDGSLRHALERELAPLRGERELGLVFERHLPEKVRLPGLPFRRGSTVEVRAEQPAPTWQVAKVFGGKAELRRRGDDGSTITKCYPIEELVVVREFGQPIYPGLKSVGRIERGGDKPFHTVVNAENYHALETLLYTCEGKVDCIYIDPPYNTGARDWKYNNDYVDGADSYRHSKWLSFMEKRLLLAKRLLHPEHGSLVVTIDENEAARLTLLLEQTFLTHAVTAVHIVHNPRGIQGDNFSHVHETALFLTPKGKAVVLPRQLSEEEIREGTSPLRNWGGESRREDAANCFYPIYVKDGKVVGFGDVVDRDADVHPAHNVRMRGGRIAVWPVDSKGVERKWRYARQTVESVKHLLVVRELKAGAMKGEIEIEIAKEEAKQKTIWSDPLFDASTHGSQLVSKMIGTNFTFPKSLYATYECLRVLVGDRPDAVVLDFFAGSGTTGHAVMALNRADGGRRRAVIVTNNEVSSEQEDRLSAAGRSPGDLEWESLGIFNSVTRPRLEAAVTGKTPTGEAIKGEYKFTGNFPLSEGFEENIEFFTLTYEDSDRVRLGSAFAAVAPMLWLMAGAVGPRVDKVADGWVLPDGGRYGVLFDADVFTGFVEAVKVAEGVTHAFVVTDSDAVFQRVVAELPDTVTPVRLYESYLRSFAINTGVLA